MEISLKRFCKIRKLSNFRNENHLPKSGKFREIPGGKSNETEIPGKTFSKNSLFLLELKH